jgi:tRNA G10  N-methylase Trm11
MGELLAVCSRESENDLVSAECAHLTGGRPGAYGVARCRTLSHVRDAAYVRSGVRCIARGKTLNHLVQAVAQRRFDARAFRIEHLRLSRTSQIGKHEAVIAVANAIDAAPNLDAPEHRFLLAQQDEGLWFGEIVTEADRTYERHDAKPCRTSSSLPSRMARALVNLVVPSARTILNPCCGTGSILLEAQAVGVEAYGVDWNPRMVAMSRQNLAHFGYGARVELGDARDWRRKGDALIADLPYGRFLHTPEAVIRGVLEAGARLAPVAVYVAAGDISRWLWEAGYGEVEVLRVRKRAGFVRCVHRAQSIGRAAKPFLTAKAQRAQPLTYVRGAVRRCAKAF